jgi:hypothetical protein
MTEEPLAMIAKTPEPPYYAVIFSSRHTGADSQSYSETAQKMEELAAEQPGHLGILRVRGQQMDLD